MKKEKLKILVLYPYPIEPDGQSLQGYYLVKGLNELGVDARSCNRTDDFQKLWAYKEFAPDVVIGIGYWGNTPEVVLSPMNHGLKIVPWFNADGWIANYHSLLNNLPLLVVTSNWVKETYNRDGVHGNIQVCHIGYDSLVFYPRNFDSGILKLREMLGIREHEKMILTAGGDVTSKGAQEMFKALAKINNKFKDWKYVLKVYDSFSAEDHGREEELLIEKLGLEKNRIIYLKGSYSPEFMAALLNACDIYAAPSRLEGFGMIQVEAMACGKPVISINKMGPAETIVHKKTGFLAKVAEEVLLEGEWVYEWMGFPKKEFMKFKEPKVFGYRADVNELKEFTLKLLTEPELCEKMGKAGREHVVENFDYHITSKKILDVTKEKLGIE